MTGYIAEGSRIYLRRCTKAMFKATILMFLIYLYRKVLLSRRSRETEMHVKPLTNWTKVHQNESSRGRVKLQELEVNGA